VWWGASQTIEYIGAAFFSEVASTVGLSVTEAMTLPDQIAYIVNRVGISSLQGGDIMSRWVGLLVKFVGLELERQVGMNELARWATGNSATPLLYLGQRILMLLEKAIPDLSGDLSGD
jgi:hypothetical protein